MANYTRALDSTRPVMAVLSRDYYNDMAAPALDLIGLNRYYSWYSNTGHLELIKQQMHNDLLNWREKYPSKPLLVTEYGADTVSGNWPTNEL